MSIQNLCDSGLTALVESCRNNQIKITNTTLCNDLEEANILYKNAKFYYSTNEYQGALVSYSCASVLLNSISRQLESTGTSSASSSAASTPQDNMKPKIVDILNCCLRAVEVLLEKTKKIKKSADEDEDEKEWDKICVKIKPLVFSKGSSNCIFFNDVAGLYEEKKTFESSLIYPLMYPNLYPKRSKGILLYGPPGTGKTYIVKAAVNELQIKGGKSVGVLFFTPSPGDLKGKYVGETEKRIEEMFTCASKAACNHEMDCKNGKKYISIIFMDEFDAIAQDRDEDPTGLAANSVNTLLQMMDGINSKPNVAVVAATNFPWSLDNAILRRFDTQILVDLPKEGDILDLLNNEMKQMIQIKPNKSPYSYCEEEKKNESSDKKTDETYNLQCSIECENNPSQELYLSAPYNKVVIDYYSDASNNNEFVKGMIFKMAEAKFSNSDISRMFKSAATNAGELAVKANLFYNAKLLDYNLQPEKYISCITKIKDEDKAVDRSIAILRSYDSNQMNNDMSYYQLKKPDIVSIEYGGYYYYNVKCLFYKSNELIIDHPLVKDVYIKYKPTTGNLDNTTLKTAYKTNVLGWNGGKKNNGFSSIDVIISFNFTFKENSVNPAQIPIFPASSTLINKIFTPIYNSIKTIKQTSQDKEKFQQGTGIQWLQTTYGFTTPKDAIEVLYEDKLFSVYGDTCSRSLTDPDPIILPYVQTIIQSNNCDITSKIKGLVYENFDLNLNNYDFLKYLLAFKKTGNFDKIYIASLLPQGSGNNFEFIDVTPDVLAIQYNLTIFTNDDDDDITTMFDKNGNHFLIKTEDFINTIVYTDKYNAVYSQGQGQGLGQQPQNQTTYIKIEKELFKILMYSSFGGNKLLSVIEKVSKVTESFYVFNNKNQIAKYFIKPEQAFIQIYINDILDFYNLAKSIYKSDPELSEATRLFNSYFTELLKLQDNNQLFLNLEQLACLRIFDNYQFAKKGKIVNPTASINNGEKAKDLAAKQARITGANLAQQARTTGANLVQQAQNAVSNVTQQGQQGQPPGQPGGGGGDDLWDSGLGGSGKKKFKLHKKDKFKSKSTKRLRSKSKSKTYKVLHGSGISYNNVEEVEETITPPTMIGGGKGYDDFISFCNNNNTLQSSTEKIAEKAIFIVTSYDINKVKEYRRNGLINNLWYGGKETIEWVSDKLNPTPKSQELKREENINNMKTKNQYLPFIFNNFKAIGFITEENKGIENDSKLLPEEVQNGQVIKKTIKIGWSTLQGSSWLKGFNSLKSLGSTALGVSDNSLANWLLVAAGEYGSYFYGNKIAILGYDWAFYTYTTGVLAANIYNFIYAADVNKSNIVNESQMASQILLPSILNIITDIRYLETSDFKITANEAFSKSITQIIEKLLWVAKHNPSNTTTTSTATYTDIKFNTEKTIVRQDMQEKLTNFNIPFKSFSYAMSVVKSTYVKENVDNLRLYKNNKDEFMEKRKKEKKK